MVTTWSVATTVDLLMEETFGARRRVRAADSGTVCGLHPACTGGGTAVNAVNAVGLVVAAGLAVFLVVALLFPERF
jgi:K+-transporting ATPase KdpF subunit